MPDAELETTRRELVQALAERDALRRELGDLRAWLCTSLGLVQQEQGSGSGSGSAPDGPTLLGVATDSEIVAEVERLRDELARFTTAEDEADQRWSGIDDLILGNRKIHAIQGIRTEFGTSLGLATTLLVERYTKLRLRYPDRFSDSPETYWDGFHS